MANQLIKAAFAVLVILGTARGEDDHSGKDTLRFYLSKSSLVVSGEIVRATTPLMPGMGIVGYSFGLRVNKVLKGELPKEMPKAFLPPKNPDVDKEDDLLWVGLGLSAGQTVPFFKKGAHVIVFLREEKLPGRRMALVEADPYFALQQRDIFMEQRLAELAKEDAKGE